MERGDKMSEEKEDVIVSSTQPAELVVKEFMTEEKKQELMNRLQGLRETLNKVEKQKVLLEGLKDQQDEHEDELDGERIFNRVQLLSMINEDLRKSMIFYRESWDTDSCEECSDTLMRSIKIYNDILDQLIK